MSIFCLFFELLLLGVSDGRFGGAGVSLDPPLAEVLEAATSPYCNPRWRAGGSGAILEREEDTWVGGTFGVPGLPLPAEPDALLRRFFSTSRRG
jgi:hypothetical protein